VQVDGLTLEGDTVDILSSLSLTFDRKMDIEHFISEMTYKLNALRFWLRYGIKLAYEVTQCLM
jgi:hypothetical protein